VTSEIEMSKDEQLEQRAVVLAVGLLTAIADPKAAKARLDDLVKATAEHDSKLEAANAALAALEEKKALFAKADSALATRIAEHQDFVSGSERNFRAREDRLRLGEEDQAGRAAKLVQAESDLARRVSAHEARVASLRETLS
jgi:hypothetical protein